MVARKAGFGLTLMINDILDYGRIKNGKLKMVPSTFSIVDVFNDIKSLVEPMIKKTSTSVQLLADFPMLEEEKMIYSDENRLK